MIVRAISAVSVSSLTVLAQAGGPGVPAISEARGEVFSCGIASDFEVAVQRGVEEQWLRARDAGRFASDFIVWRGDGEQGSSGLAIPAQLTFSFPPDGTPWGLTEIFNQVAPSDMDAMLRQVFGDAHLDLGREYIRQSLASWAQHSGLSYREVADDGAQSSTNVVRSPARGDIRVAGVSFFLAPFAGYNAFPSNNGLAKVGGADMVLNNSAWPTGRFADPTDDYRAFRVLISHEHGHGLGMIHTTPCVGEKLMEPFLSDAQFGPAIDEIRATGHHYGDRFAGNHQPALAHDFGNLTSPVRRSIRVPYLSVNGAGGPGRTGEDWFRFTIGRTEPLAVAAIPIGGTYIAEEQLSGCFPDTGAPIEASSVGDLVIELRSAADGSLIAQKSSAAPGVVEALTIFSLPAGEYLVRIRDLGPNLSETVQLYDLVIRIPSSTTAPDVCAGVDKRIAVSTNCHFIGDLNTRPTAPRAELTPESFDWDLDGDGVFETLDDPKPVFVYNDQGTYRVTLRVTDSIGGVGEHSINVTAFIPDMRVASVSPSEGEAGQSVQIRLRGENLESVRSAGQVRVLGGGVEVLGRPAVSADGTEITGLGLRIDQTAPPGPRQIVVRTGGVTAEVHATFNVLRAPPDTFSPFDPAVGITLPMTSPILRWTPSAGAESYLIRLEIDDDDDGTPDRIVQQVEVAASTFYELPVGPLRYKRTYTWSVTAIGPGGSRSGSPGSAWFRTPVCRGDADGDETVGFGDVVDVLASWNSSYGAGRSGPGDSDGNSIVDFNDITSTLSNWGAGCQ